MVGILPSKTIRPCKFYRVYFFFIFAIRKNCNFYNENSKKFCKEVINMFKKISKILSLMATGMNYSSQYLATGGTDAKMIHLNT